MNNNKVAIIGAGISGLSAAHFLKNDFDVTIFEKAAVPGGLIKCEIVNGNLFHTCGGHVFNSKRKDVLEWFWSKLNQSRDFVKADRNSVVFLPSGSEIPYPIENHIYMLNEEIQKKIIGDLLRINKGEKDAPDNFEEFLRKQFGDTLYQIYFKPYNEKVWRRDLRKVSLSWLEGKLPTPSVEEIFLNNINHVKEKNFVHSSFWYEKKKGSQHIVDSLSSGLDIRCSTPINRIEIDKVSNTWNVNGEIYDAVIYCGNIKDLIRNIVGLDLTKFTKDIDNLEYHGTTTAFCEIDKNPYSWIYQPSSKHRSHRIICTGNFSINNNSPEVMSKGRITASVEFTDRVEKNDIIENLKKMPFNPKYICHKYNEFTYPIQDANTRKLISELKKQLSPYGLYFTGRFADWEYYNMDIAIGAAMDLCEKIKNCR